MVRVALGRGRVAWPFVGLGPSVRWVVDGAQSLCRAGMVQHQLPTAALRRWE